jgi:hypothetical protein
MSQDQYIMMCEQMGWEIDEKQMPAEPSSLPIECQQALLLLNSLPDRWDGMSGSWFGKDYSGLSAIMDIYEIDNRKEIFELLQLAEQEMGKFYAQKQKERESLAKANRG